MKQFFLSLLMIAFCNIIFAQDKDKKTPEQKANKKTTEMVAQLKLTKEQETMLYSTNLKSYQSIDKYDTKEHSKKDKKKQKKIVHTLRDKEYKRILTPAQYKQWEAFKKAEDDEKDKEKDTNKEDKKKDTKKPETKTTPIKKK